MNRIYKKRPFYATLGMELTRYLLISFVLSVSISVLLYFAISFVSIYTPDDKGFLKQEMQTTISAFQDYVSQNEVASTDYDRILAWNNANWHVFMRIYDENGVLYDSLLPQEDYDGVETLQQSIMPYQYISDIHFTDKSAKVIILAFFKMRHETVVKSICFLTGILLFLFIFLIFIRKKAKYIRMIEGGMKIIESGGLNYRIPVMGSDELSSLALSINDMSAAVKQSLDAQNELKKQNYDIVTSISHDIRTPLTSVICYLDMLADGKVQNAEKAAGYLKSARQKAYQIKDLTDNLFAHSVSGGQGISLHTEKLDAPLLLGQMADDFAAVLSEKGFALSLSNRLDGPATAEADASQLARVFDNLAANIVKYADEGQPVELVLSYEAGAARVRVKNGVPEKEKEAESFGIGLKTCSRIITRHGGTFAAGKDETGKYYLASFTLPVQKEAGK